MMEGNFVMSTIESLNNSSRARLENPEGYDANICTSYISGLCGLTEIYTSGIVKGFISLDDALEFGEQLSLVNYLDNKFSYPGIENIPLFYNQTLIEVVSAKDLESRAEYNDVTITR